MRSLQKSGGCPVLTGKQLLLLCLFLHHPVAASLLRAGQKHRSHAEIVPSPADITAFYINMPDRPARRTFAESQYHSLGIRAVRVEASARPNKHLGNLFAWQRAIDACVGDHGNRAKSGSEQFCLIAEDDAVYRPINSSEAEALEEHGYPAWGKANTTADVGRFFAGLAAAVAALPGGVKGPWSGLHLCTLGEMIDLSFASRTELVVGSPWPLERFSTHLLYPGAPDVLLLRRRDAQLYQRKLLDHIKQVQKSGAKVGIDPLQSQMYSEEDAASAAGASNTLKVFAADNPQLCRHLTDYSNDPAVRSSVGDGASARNPGSFNDSWASNE